MTSQSQAKRAVGFGEGRIAVPVMLKTLCTAHSGDSEFVVFMWSL